MANGHPYSKTSLHKAIILLIGIIGIQLCLYHKFLALSIGLLGLLCVINAFSQKVKPHPTWNSALLILLYLCLVLGVTWSENKSVAYFDLEVKMSFVVFPILFGLIRLDKSDFKTIAQLFLSGILAGIFWLLLHAFVNFWSSGDFGFFTYSRLSYRIHPSYFAYYLNIGMIILIYDYFQKKLTLFKAEWIYLLLLGTMAIFCFLLTAKSGIITSSIIFIGLLIFWGRKKQWILLISSILLIVGSAGVIINKSEFVQSRITEVIEAFDVETDQRYLYSTSLRVSIWKESYDLIKEKPLLGYGTGDVKDELLKKYEEHENIYAFEKNLNAHNQFFQTALSVGVLGMIPLVLLLLMPLFKKNKLLTWFCLITILFFLTESVLETQAGVISFALFYVLLSHINIKKKTSLIP